MDKKIFLPFFFLLFIFVSLSYQIEKKLNQKTQCCYHDDKLDSYEYEYIELEYDINNQNQIRNDEFENFIKGEKINESRSDG